MALIYKIITNKAWWVLHICIVVLQMVAYLFKKMNLIFESLCFDSHAKDLEFVQNMDDG